MIKFYGTTTVFSARHNIQDVKIGPQTMKHRMLATVSAATKFLLGSVVLFSAAIASAAEVNTLAAVLKSISSDQMQQTVNFLADDALEGRGTGSRGGRAAGSYLELQFEKLHLRPAGEKAIYFQEFDAGSRNILGTLEGSDPELKKQYVVVSAHYDHVGYGSPRNSFGPIGYIHHGADDNASGVAGLLSLVEALNGCRSIRAARCCSHYGMAKRKACSARAIGSSIRRCRWNRPRSK